MAFTTIDLTRGTEVVQAPVGFSFTAVFFGLFVPLFRGDFKAFFLVLILTFASMIPFIGMVLFLACLAYPAVYNRSFIARKLKDGFVMSDIDLSKLAHHGLSDDSVFPFRGAELKNFIWLVVSIVALGVIIGLSIASAVM